MQRWCRDHERPPGAIVSIDTLWALAQEWYRDRLSATWRRRTPDETRTLFADLGLTQEFWMI